MIRRAMAILLIAGGALGTQGTALGWSGEAVAVSFINASTPTRCAEEDNIHVKLLGPGVGTFRILSLIHI